MEIVWSACRVFSSPCPASSQQGFATEQMITRSRQTPKRGTTCQRCLIIRYFILMALAVAVFAMIVDDGMRYLSFVTPMRAGLAIVAVGLMGFIVKFVMWRLEERAMLSDGPSQDAQQEAVSEETDHKSSR